MNLPAVPGVYALHLHLAEPGRIQVGRLGEISFPAAEYIYIGSACGPGGVRARLGRHLRGGQKQRWHIDYLRSLAEVRGCCFLTLEAAAAHRSSVVPLQPLECIWSQFLAGLPDAWTPVPGFGASDCRSGCRAHLVAFPLRSFPLPFT